VTRVIRNHVLHFDAPVDLIFPLFTPIKEKLWAEGWDPKIMYSSTSTAEEKGAVFLIQHHRKEPAQVWVVSHYDPQKYEIEYTQFNPDSHVTLITIRCIGTVQTDVYVSYTVITLSKAGEEYAQAFTEGHFRLNRMAWWQESIERYLKSGRSASGV
jgi:adenosyl cobinamide kinase/adenosyl cobinamide phosphate guanylyltransferase